MLLLSHPSGNTFFRAAARAFYSAELLKELNSCICWNSDSLLAKSLPRSLAVQLTRRAFPDIPQTLQHSHPWREFARLLGSAPPFQWFHRHEKGALSIDVVYQSFDRYVAKRLPNISDLSGVYSYEDAALNTFITARKLGLLCFYDLPIGYWRAAQVIFNEERELQPEWACTLSGLNDSFEKLSRKDEELRLADQIIVPSEFVRNTLLEYKIESQRIAVVPFGSPQPLLQLPPFSTTGPLKVLYVGSLGQRKGLSYALDAVECLGSKATLTLIGRFMAPECRPLMSALSRHRWIESLPHDKILEQMRLHDVLVLPSLFEGYALVISEAISQGIPVITTPNSGGTFAIRDGLEGFIVPIRDSEAIAERLLLIESDRELLYSMKLACLQRAAELSWKTYEQCLTELVERVFSKSNIN